MLTKGQLAATASAVGGGGAITAYLAITYSKDYDAEDDGFITFRLEQGKELDPSYKGKILGSTNIINLPHILKAVGKDNPNKDFWITSFKNKSEKYEKDKKEQKLDEIFKHLNEGWSDKKVEGNQTALNQACEKAYLEDKSKYVFTNESFLLKNISDFCTKDKDGYDISEPRAILHDEVPKDAAYELGLLRNEFNLKRLVKKDADNQLWWTWAFTYLYKSEIAPSPSIFSNLTSGYSASPTPTKEVALNQACEKSYKETYSQLNDTAQKLLREIKSFCTLTTKELELQLPVEPKIEGFLDTLTSYTSKFAQDERNKKVLVDPDKSELWWKWMYSNYVPSKTVGRNSYPELFEDLNSGFSNTAAQGNKQTALNQACKAAYNKTSVELSSTTNNKTSILELVKKYCIPKSLDDDNLNNPAN